MLLTQELLTRSRIGFEAEMTPKYAASNQALMAS